MNRNIILLAIFGVFLIYSCKKDTDPFFDSFPRKYIYSTSRIKEEVKMFTNRSEISDSLTIQKFVKNIKFFDLNEIAGFYSGENMEFVDGNIVKYFGHYTYLYDTLYYSKKGTELDINTEKIYSSPWFSGSNPILRKMLSWETDSIGSYHYAAGFPDGTIFRINMKYKIENNEIHIPVLGFKYTAYHFGINGVQENEFNPEVINDLTNLDTLAIVKFEVILRQK